MFKRRTKANNNQENSAKAARKVEMASKKYKFGNKAKFKKWEAAQINQAAEDKKIKWIFIGITIFFILVSVFLWWIRTQLR